MSIRKVKAGFIGFGEVYSLRELIEQKCLEVRHALESRGMELVAVTSDYVRRQRRT